MYRRLESQEILKTAARLRARIHDRFPDAGLVGVAREVERLAGSTAALSARLSQPNMILRIPFWALVVILLAGVVSLPILVHGQWGEIESLLDFVQVFEPAMGAIFFLSAMIAFFFTLEERYKRRKILSALHELRVLVHIVDMHQLTKDPSAIRPGLILAPTASSPHRTMTAAELSRYLNYCSEMVAIISKMAALYVQDFPDHHAVGAVDEIEGLTTGLARKMWQKLMMLGAVESGGDEPAEPPTFASLVNPPLG